MIDAETLRAQVRSTAPFLFPDLTLPAGEAAEEVGAVAAAPLPSPSQPEPPPAARSGAFIACAAQPRGFLDIIRATGALAQDDYFALCCACHHATVATYVPTDVDSKIRGALWKPALAGAVRASRIAFVLAARHWETSGISARVVGTGEDGARGLSGHDGEWLSVLLAALAHAVHAQDAPARELLEQTVDDEIRRQAGVFQRLVMADGRELAAMGAASILTHNAGDIDQAISYWPKHPGLEAMRMRFGRLAHDQLQAYDGAFITAARIYKATLSPEGHRNYPLRAVKALRHHPALLLPIAPFLDDWGGVVATHPSLNDTERLEVVGALIDGAARIDGQRGYYRALHGLRERWAGSVTRLMRHLSPAQRRGFEQLEMQKQLAVTRPAFELMMKKRFLAARALTP